VRRPSGRLDLVESVEVQASPQDLDRDEMEIDLAPMLLGGGERRFDGTGDDGTG
jgi:hypothetical protein